MNWLSYLNNQILFKKVIGNLGIRLRSRTEIREKFFKNSTLNNSQIINIDYELLWIVIALLSLGIVMVYSASITMPDSPKYASYHNYEFLMRHCMSIIFSAIVSLIVFQIPVATWNKFAPRFFLIALISILITLIPKLGKDVNGARRWIRFGLISIQPSEIMKLAVTVYVANYTVRKQKYMQSFLKGFLPIASAITFIGIPILLEPDMGAIIMIIIITMGLLFIGGVSGKLFSGLVMTAVSVFTMIIWLSPWRRERIFAYLDPWNKEYSQSRAYQLIHSLIAFGRGNWFGVGLGKSVEKLNYLPEAHTDFILAVIGEELGFVSVMIVILLFYWIVYRAFKIGYQALALDCTFAALMAKGIGILFGAQGFINMGVSLGLLPTKGLTLPLISYGGSGILLNCIAMSMLLRVDYENRLLLHENKL
ncbi:MAG: putative lipid II flippase FtsW [Burkholderia sp.]|nr:putative lipid II flippase FtsW [Burkholderia sp.]